MEEGDYSNDGLSYPSKSQISPSSMIESSNGAISSAIAMNTPKSIINNKGFFSPHSGANSGGNAEVEEHKATTGGGNERNSHSILPKKGGSFMLVT